MVLFHGNFLVLEKSQLLIILDDFSLVRITTVKFNLDSFRTLVKLDINLLLCHCAEVLLLLVRIRCCDVGYICCCWWFYACVHPLITVFWHHR